MYIHAYVCVCLYTYISGVVLYSRALLHAAHFRQFYIAEPATSKIFTTLISKLFILTRLRQSSFIGERDLFLILITVPTEDKVWRFHWNCLRRLRRVTFPDRGEICAHAAVIKISYFSTESDVLSKTRHCQFEKSRTGSVCAIGPVRNTNKCYPVLNFFSDINIQYRDKSNRSVR